MVLFPTTVAADKVGAVVADSQLRNEDKHLLPVSEYVLTEYKYIRKRLARSICFFWNLKIYSAISKNSFSLIIFVPSSSAFCTLAVLTDVSLQIR